MMKFMKNRKKENRQSLIIDNLDLEKLNDTLDINDNYNNLLNSQDVYSESESGTFPFKESRLTTNTIESNIKSIRKIYEPESQDGNEHNQTKEEEGENICKTQNQHVCNICFNKKNIKDTFIILTCGHIFHIRCLVDIHYSDASKYRIIDEDYFNSRCCLVCNNQMEMEDILYIHNKFYKSTKEYLVKQDDRIDIIDKQMSKLKEELRICYDYKQRLEQQREKSKQITVTINTLM